MRRLSRCGGNRPAAYGDHYVYLMARAEPPRVQVAVGAAGRGKCIGALLPTEKTNSPMTQVSQLNPTVIEADPEWIPHLLLHAVNRGDHLERLPLFRR